MRGQGLRDEKTAFLDNSVALCAYSSVFDTQQISEAVEIDLEYPESWS